MSSSQKHILDKEIAYLKGVGPSRAALLRTELHLKTYEDLLQHFPFRYVDKSQVVKIKQIEGTSVAIQIMGVFKRFQEMGEGKAKRLVGIFGDDTGDLEVIWFKGIKWIRENLKAGVPYLLYGKPATFKGRYSLTHPEIESLEDARLTQGIELKPIYSTTEKLIRSGLTSHALSKLTMTMLSEVSHFGEENIPLKVRQELQLMDRSEALRQVHIPSNMRTLEAARKRLKFEELFYLQLQLVRQKRLNTKDQPAVRFQKVGAYFNTFYSEYLPFELTLAQKRVVKEIRNDVGRGYHMSRLVQGDVGSGKTIVALLAALIAMDNDFQVCLMAPTEILAHQHYHGIAAMLDPLLQRFHEPNALALLTGSTSKARKKEIMQLLQNGSIKLLIGTHALIEPYVQYKNLGLVIIDEQHRFGVMQRAALWKKAALPPHVLVMTATPIPRTLAMTLYGDLDISVIDELPPGRKPIDTRWKGDQSRTALFGFMKQQIELGRQIYIVYPLIEESEALDYKDLEDGYESISRAFPPPVYQISVVHGRMKSEHRDMEMARFIKGETQIMIATTVIEVGVNVPNASVMVIESAERFGLSQLHQLRGRVGRGAEQSYCILMCGPKMSEESKKRMQTMVDTNDGFKIAEVDLEIRGPGDLSGTQQSGMLNLKISDLSKDQLLLSQARESVLTLIDKDPELIHPDHHLITGYLRKMASKKSDLSRIS
jgi:ATP-dependent DNA helicase RecG